MPSTSHRATSVPIDQRMRSAFKRNAPAALARRNDAYMLGIALNVGQWLLIGAIGLLGLYRWQWTASELLLVFVVGIVAAIIADVVKWLFARRTMLAEYRMMEADRLVWAMLDAETRGDTHVRADQVDPRKPGAALLLDIGLGALGIWLLSDDLHLFELAEGSVAGPSLGVRIGLLAVLCAPVLVLLVSTIAHRRTEGGFDELEFRAGGRGIGLVLLALVLGFSAQGEDAARDLMGFIHGATVIAGLMSIAGVFIMLGERDRLRERLEADPTPRRTPADQDP